jgi:hypothetical protein
MGAILLKLVTLYHIIEPPSTIARLAHGAPLPWRLALDAQVGSLLAEGLALHQHTLGPLHHLARIERLVLVPACAGMNPRAERAKPLRGWILARRASFFQPDGFSLGYRLLL